MLNQYLAISTWHNLANKLKLTWYINARFCIALQTWRNKDTIPLGKLRNSTKDYYMSFLIFHCVYWFEGDIEVLRCTPKKLQTE